jgi:hypothetical protein
VSPAQAEGVVAGKTGDRQRWAFLSGLDVGADGDPYLDRLRIIQTPWFGVYLHHIHRPDKDPDPHDHPWWFTSLVLAGKYQETVWPDKRDPSWRQLRLRPRWSWASTSRRAAHLISSIDGPLWTLVITGPRRADWGFWEKPPGQRAGHAVFVPWREYTARHGGVR